MTEQHAVQHGPEGCYWLREKEYVFKQLKAIEDRIERMETKLDTYVDTAVTTKMHEKEIDSLSEKVGISLEEIAALKVKASLLGIGSAALIELAFVLVKNYSGK